MKRILCYGDSNTQGSDGTDIRIPDAEQWPNILQRLLGDTYRVVQEGLGGRVAGNLEAARPYLNGKDSFEVIYRSASPLDLVVISLGTNDLKKKYERTAQDITDDLLWYQEAIAKLHGVDEGRATKILYICPANFIASKGYFEASQSLRSSLIKRMRDFGEPIVEFDNLEMVSDNLHYSKSAHQLVAETVRQKIEEIV